MLSRKGREYRRAVSEQLFDGKTRHPLEQRLALHLHVYPPDRRKRDLDNPLKAVLDALQKAGVLLDDSQIDNLHVHRRSVTKPGKIKVVIWPAEARLSE